jgi:hypothetical protein
MNEVGGMRNGISSARGARMSLSVGIVSFVFLPRKDAKGSPRGMVKPVKP